MNKFIESSKHFPVISNPSTDTFDRVFSVSLSVLKVVIMGCVSMDIAPLYQTTLGESAVGV
jgi:hypothetical protein